MELRLNPRQIAIAFLAVVAVLAVINNVLLFFYFYLGDDDLFGLVDLFDFAIEGNVPTLYSAVAILFCSMLLALITHTNWRKPDGNRFYWLGLSILFLFLAFDEGAEIHEAVGTFFEDYMEARGALYFLWVVPYGIATLALMLVYLRFVWALPSDTRWRFVVAGVTFLSGALGLEMLGAREADLHDTTTLTYSILYTLEELLEMLGIVVFIHALLLHLARDTGGFAIVLAVGEGGSSQTQGDREAREIGP